MDKKKRDALVIVGVLVIVFVVTLAATIIVPKLSKEKETGNKENSKKTTWTAEETQETTTWEFEILEIKTISPEEREEIKEEYREQKRQNMRSFMTPTDYKIECETCTISVEEMYFDEDTMDGCFHIAISVKDDTVIDETWYTLDEEGINFGKYTTEENGESVEKWRYNIVTNYFYCDLDNSLVGSTEIIDNVLHIYTWLNDDSEIESHYELINGENVECYILGYLFDSKLSEENPESYSPKSLYVNTGIKYNKTVALPEQVEVVVSPTSVLIKGNKTVTNLYIMYSQEEMHYVFDETDPFNLFLDSILNRTDGKKYVLTDVLRFEEVMGVEINGKRYYFE